MSEALEVLSCKHCKAAVPLVDASCVPCQFCGKSVAIPTTHTTALRLSLKGQETRMAAAQKLERLGEKPQTGMLWLATFAIVIMPSIAVYLASRSISLALSHLELNVYAGVPAILPGVGLYIWAAAAHGTSLRFCDALSAKEPLEANGCMRCRRCGAPLSPPQEGHVVCCAYCHSDNLLRHVNIDVLQEHLRSSLTTMGQAMHLLRIRRGFLALGILFSVAIASGLIVAVRLAQ